ncbi:TetR/AcrR family transcriptional regulator [Ruania albidiflava]|uniref:TetR/AcrR family transcriptional regulator n=1 Tax=Ruania albidiflava TaxID=366586 RepID=UPI000A0363C5|nr:TetR family transcriptional regulator [Ruania albidiflava]
MSPAQRIDRTAVVAATFELIDHAGLAGLTMRALATRLGVQAASLYHHVAGRDELLRLVADSVAQTALARVSATPDWRALARGLADGMRSVLREHPGAAQIVAVQEVSPAVFDPVMPLVNDAFLPALDIDDETALHLLQGLIVLVVGLASAECGNVPNPPAAPAVYYDTWYEVAVETFLDGVQFRYRPQAPRA